MSYNNKTRKIKNKTKTARRIRNKSRKHKYSKRINKRTIRIMKGGENPGTDPDFNPNLRDTRL